MRCKVQFGCLFVVLAFLLAGCQGSDPIAPQSTERAIDIAALNGEDPVVTVSKPFRGKYATTFTPPTTPPPVLEFYIWGEGQSSLLGSSTWEGPSWVDLTQVPPVQGSTAVFTAADGSQITMNSTGIAGPGPDAVYDVAFSGTFTLDDGTDRLAGATGEGTYQGVASNSLGIGRIAFNGTMTMPKPPGD